MSSKKKQINNISKVNSKNKQTDSKKTKTDDEKLDIIKSTMTQLKKKIDEVEPDYRQIMDKYDPSKNISSPILTEYEKTSVIGKRATQIANGSPIFIERKPNMKEEDIAEAELIAKKIPFGVERKVGLKTEYWRLCDMIIN